MGTKRIIITGAGGALGTALMHSLKSDLDFEVFALSRDPRSLEARIGTRSQLHFVKTENMRFEDVGNVDVFLHCAYPRVSVGPLFAEGLQSTFNMMLEASQATVAAAILISSQSVYDPQRHSPADEGADLGLTSTYSVGKYMMEIVFHSAFQVVPHSVIRLGSLLGEDIPERAVNKMIQQVVHGQSLKVLRTAQVFDYLDVKDAANALHQMMRTDASTWRSQYNLGSGRSYSSEEIGSTIQTICSTVLGREISLEVNDAEAEGNSGLNSDAFYHDFSWSPSHSLASTVHRLCVMEMGNTAK